MNTQEQPQKIDFNSIHLEFTGNVVINRKASGYVIRIHHARLHFVFDLHDDPNDSEDCISCDVDDMVYAKIVLVDDSTSIYTSGRLLAEAIPE